MLLCSACWFSLGASYCAFFWVFFRVLGCGSRLYHEASCDIGLYTMSSRIFLLRHLLMCSILLMLQLLLMDHLLLNHLLLGHPHLVSLHLSGWAATSSKSLISSTYRFVWFWTSYLARFWWYCSFWTDLLLWTSNVHVRCYAFHLFLSIEYKTQIHICSIGYVVVNIGLEPTTIVRIPICA